jgi:hypothetical protein
MLIEDIKKYVIERTEAFKKELNEEVKQMIKEANQDQVKSIWDLKTKDEEEYYRLYHNGAIILCTFSSSIDRLFRYLGNAFLTKEEAEFELERRKIEAIMRKYSRPFEDGKTNYFLVCNRGGKTAEIDYYWSIDCGVPYFESEEIAQKVIDEIGEDRLKKYWFRIEG